MAMPRIGRWVKWGAIGLVALLVLGFGVGTLANRRSEHPAAVHRGVSSSSGGAGDLYAKVPGGNGSAEASYDSSTVDAVGAPEYSALTARTSGGGSSDTAPGLGDRIIRSADLSVKIKKGAFDDAWASAARIANRLGGYVVSSGRGSQPTPVVQDAKAEPESGDLTVRVPTSRFEQALIEMRALGTVTSDQLSSQDVTEEFVDLQSRLRNQKSQQAVLIRLMAQAKNVQETLAVQQQLSQVEDEIERITGRLNALKTLTDLSTISLHLFEPGAVGAPVPPDEGPSFSKAWHTSLDGLIRIGTLGLIGSMWLAPFALLAVALAAVRRLRAGPASV
ncbi:MAG: DUF4349 domain-containing protein [Actinomycetota bacterium]|nr:DUF4349 domain-containing protein [Actinomycetota bacterium]